MDAFLVLFILSFVVVAPACRQIDQEAISRVLFAVDDWKGLALSLDLHASNRIETECAHELSGARHECYRRSLVRRYCDKGPFGSPEEVAEQIAHVLEETMGHKRQAQQLRELRFEGEDRAGGGRRVSEGQSPNREETKSPPPQTSEQDSSSLLSGLNIQRIVLFVLLALISYAYCSAHCYRKTGDQVPMDGYNSERRFSLTHDQDQPVSTSTPAEEPTERNITAPAMASGKDSPQYKIVKDNLKHIVGTLKTNTAAHDALRMSVKSKGWLEVHDKPRAEDLVSIILNRIEHNASDYDMFMDMLCSTDGMDLIARRLQLPGSSAGSHTSLHPCTAYDGRPPTSSSLRPRISNLPSAVSGARPTISQLYQLKSRRGWTVRVIETSAPRWRFVAYALNLSSASVDSIERSSFYQPVKACEIALSRWMTEALTGQPVCWASLLQALRHADLTTLASDLELVLMENDK